jgi:hypothetical protein
LLGALVIFSFRLRSHRHTSSPVLVTYQLSGRVLPRRLVICALALGLTISISAATVAPLAIRHVNPDMLSGGLFGALDAAGAFGRPPLARYAATANGTADLSKGRPAAILDARVGANIRLGDDPSVLPVGQRGQAEPHIYRSVRNPSVLLATFQEGRFSTSGSLDCGYAVSLDGGLTWSRALIPQLTTASGGVYNRATDPVAAGGPGGELYLNTLGSVSGEFDIAAVLVSRSLDNGTTWSSPTVVYQAPSTLVMPDKNWLTANDYSATANSGRLVATWTNFTATSSGAASGNNLMAATSDDRGATWSPPIAITSPGATNQGTQPVFLPDGSLVVVYVTFPDLNTTSQFAIECKRSADGGRTFPTVATTIAPIVLGWDDPDLRDGVFLPAAAVARQSGEIFVAYTALVNGTPRVYVTKSADQGASWTPPVVVSDNPVGVSVVNPAITVTPDGKGVSVVFMDKRNASDGHNFVDIYAAQSFDGGVTWQPNIRLTEMSSDIRYAPLTSRGYMFGDYMGIAPALNLSQPCVAIWCDTRTGDSDPFTVRLVAADAGNYGTWATAHAIPAQSGLPDDADGDGDQNYFEYIDGTDPLRNEGGENLFIRHSSSSTVDIAWVERADAQHSYPDGLSVTSMRSFNGGAFSDTATIAPNLSSDQLPSTSVASGLVWRGVRVTTQLASAAARSFKLSAGLPVTASKAIATFNTDSRLINVSTRGTIAGTGDQIMVGFVLDGSKSMLVRAAGPALTAYGVSSPLAHPQLSLAPLNNAVMATNANWLQGGASSVSFAQLGAFPFASGSADAAIQQSLGAGPYSATVTGRSGESGVVLVEAYDADPSPGSPLGPRVINLSSRGQVVGDSAPLIAGFVITGTDPRRILIRAVGPTLAQFGVGSALPDPTLTLYAANGVIATNDDWQISRSPAATAATAQRLGAFPLTAAGLDAALLVTLRPGPYTVVVTGANGAQGTALIEVYDAD